MMLQEAEEEAKVNAKIGALQRRLKEAERKWIEAEKAKAVAERRASIAAMSDTVDDGGYAESAEMLEYLKNEISQQKESNHLLMNQLQESRKAHSNLQEQYTSLKASHVSVKKNAHALRRENSILVSRTKDIKQRYSKLKKAMKKLKIDCQIEVGKMVEIMIAKESESSREIAKLQAEVKNLKKGMRNKFARGGTKRQDKKYHLNNPLRPSSTSSLSGSETRHVSSETTAMTSLQRALSQSNFGSDSVSSTKMSSLAMAAMRLSAE
jgi:chromosome segregation ATPase